MLSSGVFAVEKGADNSDLSAVACGAGSCICSIKFNCCFLRKT